MDQRKIKHAVIVLGQNRRAPPFLFSKLSPETPLPEREKKEKKKRQGLFSLSSGFSCKPSTARSSMHHSGRMSSSTTTMASHALCHTSMQPVFLRFSSRKGSPYFKNKKKKISLPGGPKTSCGPKTSEKPSVFEGVYTILLDNIK